MQNKSVKLHVRTKRGVVHALTVGRRFHGDGYKQINTADRPSGRADCNSHVSMAAVFTDEPLTCQRCIDRPWEPANSW